MMRAENELGEQSMRQPPFRSQIDSHLTSQDMSVCCAVCNSSFKDSNALQMHKTAKGHNDPAVGRTSGKPTSTDPSQKKSNRSNAASSTARKDQSSGASDFRLGEGGRSLLSRGVLAAHAETRTHSVADTAKVKPPGKTVFRCDICGRCNFVSRDALNDHKRNAKNHQTRIQERASPRMPSELGKEADHRSSPSSGHASTLLIDKMVQCDLCSCNFPIKKTYESHLVTRSSDGNVQQDTSQSNAGIQSYPLVIGHRYYGGITTSCQETFTDLKEHATEAASEQSILIKGADKDGVPPVRSSILISQASLVEDQLVQHSPNLQVPANMVDVRRPIQSGQLAHLGKEWSAMSLFEQPLALKILRDLCHPVPDLEKNGYRLRRYTLTELLGRQRCKRCNSTLS